MATTADDLVAEANAAYADAKTLADNALTQSSAALTAAETAIGLTQASGSSWFGPATIPPDRSPVDVEASDIEDPTSVIDPTTSVATAYATAFGTYPALIQSQILNFLDAFFPDIAAGVKTGSDQWIIDTIANGRFVPIAVETALWNRAKDREVIEALRVESEIIAASASRGFSAPSGVLTYAIATNQQELNKRTTTINREISIKAFDTANENTKFAIQQAVALRTAFVAAMGDFIKTAMVQPNNAVDYAKLILASKTGFYDSAVKLYSAKIGEEKMRTDVLRANRSIDMNMLDLESRDNQASALITANKAASQADVAIRAAEQLGRVAAAAMQTRNSMVSVSAGV